MKKTKKTKKIEMYIEGNGQGGGAGPYMPLKLREPIQIVVGSGAGNKTTIKNLSKKEKELDKAIDAHNKKSFEGSWDDINIKSINSNGSIAEYEKEWDNVPDSQFTAQQVKDWSRFKPQDEKDERLKYYAKIGFSKKMLWYDKVTWVLTVMNVAILITLVLAH